MLATFGVADLTQSAAFSAHTVTAVVCCHLQSVQLHVSLLQSLVEVNMEFYTNQNMTEETIRDATWRKFTKLHIIEIFHCVW